MHKFLKAFGGLFLLLLTGQSLAATSGQQAVENADRWVARHFTTSDGLPVSGAADARIDGDGYLWVATTDGLVRFDGLEFRIFDASSLPDLLINRFIQLAPGPNGAVYALSQDGMLFRARGKSVQRVRPDPAHPGAAVSYLQDQPLCATLATGLYCADDSGHFEQRLSLDPAQGVTAALPAGTDANWLLVPDKGVWLQHGNARRHVSDLTPPKLGRNDPMTVALASTNGALSFATDDGIVQLQTDGSARRLQLPRPENGLQVFAVEQKDAKLLVSSNTGIYALDNGQLRAVSSTHIDDHDAVRRIWIPGADDVWESIGRRLYHNGVLVFTTGGSINHLTPDGQGSYWIATEGSGLYELSRPRVSTFDTSDGLRSNNVYGLSATADGGLWIGELGGALQLRHPDGSLETYGPDSGLPGPHPWNVLAAPDGNVYVSSYAPGILRRLSGQNRFVPMPALPDGSKPQIRSLSIDHDGLLWIGANEGAETWNQGQWQRQWPTLGNAAVTAVLHARDGSHWLGSKAGLWRLEGSDALRIAPDLLINGIVIRDIFEDSRGDVWICTVSHGLIRIRQSSTGHYETLQLGRDQGLPSNSPHALLEDSGGYLWVNSNRGIFRLDPQDLDDYEHQRVPKLSPLVLGASDGIEQLEGNGGVQPAAARSGDGTLWFPTQSGVVYFNPARLKLRRSVPKAYIDTIIVDGRPHATLNNPLPSGLQTLEIHYSAVALHAGDAVRFRYRLQPSQKRWLDAGPQRKASFTGLAPGHYRFELIVSNGDGVWSQTPLTLPLWIKPLWYQTTLFRVLAVLALIALAVSAVARRNRLLRLRADELDRKVQQRTEELRQETRKLETTLEELGVANQELAGQTRRLEAMGSFRTRLLADISHELRTPLMLVTLVLRELSDSSKGLKNAERLKAERSLRQAGRLNAMVKQLIELARADADQIVLNKASVELVAFTENLIADLRPLTQETGIALHFASALREQWIEADPERLTIMLSNLIVNASKHAPRDSTVDVRLSASPTQSMVRIQVIDRGAGFAPEVAERLFQRYFTGDDGHRGAREGLGIGLALAQELTERHNGVIGAISQPGQDTTFWIELPVSTRPAPASRNSTSTETSSTPDNPLADPVSADSPTAYEIRPARRGVAVRQVLIVEDHAELSEYLRDKLSEWVDVVTASTGAEARQQLDQRLPDLLLCDIKLPDTTGIHLVTELRQQPQSAALPVLLMSAQPRPGEVDQLSAPVEFLSKPFTLQELRAAMARIWPAIISLMRTLEEEDDAPQHPLLEIARQGLPDSGFGIGRWAELAHLSERQLRRRVIDLTGVAPLTWLREQRLRRVHYLVSSGKCRTLAEAGAQSGIDTPSYLYKLYRERFGDT